VIRQPSPELARRAAAFDRVIEALRAVAELSDEDLAIVAPDSAGREWSVYDARRIAEKSATRLASADRALNAELSALDDCPMT
jgi:sigma54-dependent transcription regulator